MTENDIIREKRRAKFLEKLDKKTSTQSFFANEDDNIIKATEEPKEIIKEVKHDNSIIKTQIIKLDRDDEKKEENSNNENTQFNYRDIYNKQKYFESLKEIQSYLRFLIFIIYGVLHYQNINIFQLLDFSEKAHLFTIFLITESALFFFNKSIDSQNNNIISEMPSEPLTKMIHEKQLMDLLSILEKAIKYFRTPFLIILDLSAFLFVNILCFFIIH